MAGLISSRGHGTDKRRQGWFLIMWTKRLLVAAVIVRRFTSIGALSTAHLFLPLVWNGLGRRCLFGRREARQVLSAISARRRRQTLSWCILSIIAVQTKPDLVDSM